MALNESGPDPEDEELERQVDEMAKKVLEYRATLPVQLKNTVASILAVQPPVFLDGSGPGTSGAPNFEQVASNKWASLADGDQTFERMQLHKDKIPSNVAALPIVLKRAEECSSKIDKLDPQNRIIRSAFQKKRTS
ncbi:uncharacterized protein LOC126631870 isoform X2 [Malus sylvestris]|uniref:uncharacterized protein LOC126631870 isoform X2 n=1 Tax=Malus sylvestris TaxID=3752 RepID=UPI0021AC239C|nr:uncharacterized protein LOC126631870 isoform X2 [Malus sylvestris]